MPTGTAGHWDLSLARPGWYSTAGRDGVHELYAGPVGNGFRWEVWGPAEGQPYAVLDSGPAASAEEARQAAEESAAPRTQESERKAAARDFSARAEAYRNRPDLLEEISTDYYQVRSTRDETVTGYILAGGPTAATRFKAIGSGDDHMNPETAPGGYGRTLEEAAALLGG